MRVFCHFAILHILLGATTQYQSSMTMYIFPPASSTVFVYCWSNSTTAPFKQSSEYNFTGEITWSIETSPGTSNFYDGYWCRARMGSNVMVRFPVYGDGIERNSSEWLINSRGRRRLSMNGRVTDDQRGNWVIT